MLLPEQYDNYIFDLYGTLVDIHTEEGQDSVWEKMSLFMGYYDAVYTSEELQKKYHELIKDKEKTLKKSLEKSDSHEAFPEIDIKSVFQDLYQVKNVKASEELIVHTGQFFRALSTEYIKIYDGTKEMLSELRKKNKKIYLLSNAQQIFTQYEMHMLQIAEFFDDIFISSDYGTKKPDKRFFRLLVERHALDISRSLFIGNDSRADIAGAKQIGIDTFYVCSNISPTDDHAKDATYQIDPFESWIDKK